MRISSRILAIVAGLILAGPAFAADRSATPETINGAPSYVSFEPIFIPVITGDSVTRQVGITLVLQLARGEDKQDVVDKARQLNNAFVEDLYAFFQQRAALPGEFDEQYLKSRLLKVADGVVGPHVVKEVLIEQFFEQPK